MSQGHRSGGGGLPSKGRTGEDAEPRAEAVGERRAWLTPGTQPPCHAVTTPPAAPPLRNKTSAHPCLGPPPQGADNCCQPGDGPARLPPLVTGLSAELPPASSAPPPVGRPCCAPWEARSHAGCHSSLLDQLTRPGWRRGPDSCCEGSLYIFRNICDSAAKTIPEGTTSPKVPF